MKVLSEDSVVCKARYIQLCHTEGSIPIFSQPWWLDAVCGENNWDVAVVEKGGEIQASMPYYMKCHYGFKILVMPQLTQTLGPWIRPSQAKYVKRLGREKVMMNALVEQLPRFDYFSQNWHYNSTNWQPFYWKGFGQTTFYTYVITDLGNDEKVWRSLKENIRSDIRKATNRFKLTSRDSLEIDAFLELNKMTYERQGKILPYSEIMVKRLDKACAERGCRKIWIAEDEEGRQHAGVYIVWDESSAYYLIGGGNPDLRNSGASSFLIWEAIKYAGTVTKKFDFEGSMVENIERFFRGFGAIQKPYFNITKINSPLLQIQQYMLPIIKNVFKRTGN